VRKSSLRVISRVQVVRMTMLLLWLRSLTRMKKKIRHKNVLQVRAPHKRVLFSRLLRTSETLKIQKRKRSDNLPRNARQSSNLSGMHTLSTCLPMQQTSKSYKQRKKSNLETMKAT